jgi:hypothetical protein
MAVLFKPGWLLVDDSAVYRFYATPLLGALFIAALAYQNRMTKDNLHGARVDVPSVVPEPQALR